MVVSSINFKFIEKPKAVGDSPPSALLPSRFQQSLYIADERQYILQSLWYGHSPQCSYRVATGYANQLLHPHVENMAWKLLSDLHYYEQRVRNANPHKAKSKQRLVVGGREVLRAMRPAPLADTGWVKVLIVAIDVEESTWNSAEWGEVRRLARQQHLPLVFALTRKEMPCALGRRGCVTSIVGVGNAEGCYQLVAELCDVVRGAELSWCSVAEELLMEELKRGRADLLGMMAKYGHLSVVQAVYSRDALLVETNVDFVESATGRTALMQAVQNQHESIAALLLEAKASVQLCDFGGKRVIHYAARNACLATFKLLWSAMDRTCQEDMVSDLENASDIWMLAMNSKAIISFIMESLPGLRITVQHIVGAIKANQPTIFLQLLPFWLAPLDADLAVMLHAIAQGGNTNFWNTLHQRWLLGEWKRTAEQIAVILNQRDAAGRTAAWVAASLGHVPMARRLIALGSDPNFCHPHKGHATTVLELLCPKQA